LKENKKITKTAHT